MHAARSGQGGSRHQSSLRGKRGLRSLCSTRRLTSLRSTRTLTSLRSTRGLTSLRSTGRLTSLRSERGVTSLGGSRNRAVRAARAAAVRFARLAWPAVLAAFAACWAAPATHADERDDSVAITPAVAAAGQPAGASETAPSGAASFAKTSPALAKLLGLGDGIVIGDSNEDDFLDPELAFVLSAAAAGPDAIGARWDIAEGYYLYRDKFRFRAADGSGASLGDAGFPEGMLKDDEYFGPMEVYYGSVAALVPVTGAAPGGAVDVDITYQGCADAGLCYPPITKTVSLLLPAALADTGAGTGPGAGASGLSDAGSAGTPAAASNLQARVAAGAGASGASGLSNPGTERAVPGIPGLPGPAVADITPHRDAGAGPGRHRAHVRQPLARGPVAVRGGAAADVHPVRAADGADPHQHHRGPRGAARHRKPRRPAAPSRCRSSTCWRWRSPTPWRGCSPDCSARTSRPRSRTPGSCRRSRWCSCCSRSRCSGSTSSRCRLRGRPGSPPSAIASAAGPGPESG